MNTCWCVNCCLFYLFVVGAMPANAPNMAMPPSGYGNAGEQLMMVLNGGGPYQGVRNEFPNMQSGQMGNRSGDNREFSMVSEITIF